MKDYTGYISAAYGFAALVVGWLAVSIVRDYRELKNKLARFGKAEDVR